MFQCFHSFLLFRFQQSVEPQLRLPVEAVCSVQQQLFVFLDAFDFFFSFL